MKELEITIKIPETDFDGIDVLIGIAYLEKRLAIERPDSGEYTSCQAALKVLRAIVSKIDTAVNT